MQSLALEIDRLAVEVSKLHNLRQGWCLCLRQFGVAVPVSASRSKHTATASVSAEVDSLAEAPLQSPYVANLKAAAAHLQAAYNRQKLAVHDAIPLRKVSLANTPDMHAISQKSAKGAELSSHDNSPYIADAGHEDAAEVEAVAKRFLQVRNGLFAASVRLSDVAAAAAVADTQEVAFQTAEDGGQGEIEPGLQQSLARLVAFGHISEALKRFGQMCKDGSAVAADYNLIMGIVDDATAEKLYARMGREHTPAPQADTLHVLVKKYVRRGDAEAAVRVVSSHQSSYGQPSKATYQALIGLLGPRPSAAIEGLLPLPMPWDYAMVEALCDECTRLNDAQALHTLYEILGKKGSEGVFQDSLAILLRAASATEQVDLIDEILGQLGTVGQEMKPSMYQDAAHALGQYGEEKHLEALEQQMDKVGGWSMGMYTELARAYATLRHTEGMTRVIRRCAHDRRDFLRGPCKAAARACAYNDDSSGLGEVLALMNEHAVRMDYGIFRTIVQCLALAAQVDLIERFIEYGRAHKIRVDDDIQGNRKHAYNVRWMIESIDQRRSLGDIEGARLVVWRMYRLASLSTLELFARRHDYDGVAMVIKALIDRGATLNNGTRIRVLRAFKHDKELYGELKQLLVLLPSEPSKDQTVSC